ncbi:MAG: hypothetical protein WB297_14950 [Actinomycetota bacterium]
MDMFRVAMDMFRVGRGGTDEVSVGDARTPSDELTIEELAVRAGVGEDEIERLVAHGVLGPREGRTPFRAIDAVKIRLARADGATTTAGR